MCCKIDSHSHPKMEEVFKNENKLEKYIKQWQNEINTETVRIIEEHNLTPDRARSIAEHIIYNKRNNINISNTSVTGIEKKEK